MICWYFQAFLRFSCASDIFSEYSVLNFSFLFCLKWPLTVRSKSWKMWVMFAGSLTKNILLHFNFLITFFHEKHPLYVELGDLVEGVAHASFRYGTMISSIILRASAVLLKYFGFMLVRMNSGNQHEERFER